MSSRGHDRSCVRKVPLGAGLGYPVIAVALAIGISLIDTFAGLEIPIAVLYAGVVLLSINFQSKHGVIITAIACASLTLLSFLISHGWTFTYDEVGHRVISLAAIATTAFLALKIRAATLSLQQTQAELAHIARVATLGELTASIAHEINQPLAAIAINGEACVRFLNRETPDLDAITKCVTRMISDSHRASQVIGRLSDLYKKTELKKARLDINGVIDESIILVQHQMYDYRVALRLDLASGLAPVHGDRIQLQQGILNLVVNGIDAMAAITDRPRVLLIKSGAHEPGQVLVAVQDSGMGIDPENADRLFNAFFTTKSKGLGMGLSICRSIIQAHDGRLWASPNTGPGVTFQFTVPTYQDQPRNKVNTDAMARTTRLVQEGFVR